MTTRMLILIFGVGVQTASGCDCPYRPATGNLSDRDVVFRGTIIALRGPTQTESKQSGGREYQIAVFAVDRIWKGEIQSVFEMPAIFGGGDCEGFGHGLLKIGNDLLVYARKHSPDLYYQTNLCTRTRLSANAAEDFRLLGSGHKPGR